MSNINNNEKRNKRGAIISLLIVTVAFGSLFALGIYDANHNHKIAKELEQQTCGENSK